jgi:plastocyanin
MRKKRWIVRLSAIGALVATACAVSCAGDDTLLELPLFDGGFDAPGTFDSGSDVSSTDAESDARTQDAGVDAGFDSGPIDSGSDSGIHVVIDAGVDAGVDSGVDAGVGVDAGDDASADASDDSGVDGGDGGSNDSGITINGCTSFTDLSDPAASRVVQGPSGSGPVQYTPSCMTIKTGQSVTFQEGDFSNHPLEPVNGTMPSPITGTSVGTTVTFAFPTVGTYGFKCEFHPDIMFGAINVVP